jgi:cytochrome c biogenesis protein CcmG/thiol:disulfide interchange protein DsbE
VNGRLPLVVAVAAALLVGERVVHRVRGHAGAATPAPALALPDLAGRTVDLRALRGKVVAVNFWATWCGPCRLEMPDLAKAWREAHGSCLEILGVAEESAREDVVHATDGLPYPILIDERGEAAARWKIPGYPYTFLVDPEGKVRRVFEGSVSRGELLEAARPLLPATCPAS